MAGAAAAGRVLLCGQDSDFFEYAAFHLAAAGLRTVPFLAGTDRLALGAVIDQEQPCAVLLHWDTLGERALAVCATLKQGHAPLVFIVCESLQGGLDVVSAFDAGADGLIEGAHNPRIFLTRMRSLLSQAGEIAGI